MFEDEWEELYERDRFDAEYSYIDVELLNPDERPVLDEWDDEDDEVYTDEYIDW